MAKNYTWQFHSPRNPHELRVVWQGDIRMASLLVAKVKINDAKNLEEEGLRGCGLGKCSSARNFDGPGHAIVTPMIPLPGVGSPIDR
ncbi:hypothetical protein OWV82_024846 [Melia azedarach]|uniref:Uncharacterized protein n=1 Tax=Melia azedarach TaxID=155640 RepID=A0ACC1WRN3_MELAZ|nr:hypothetical protein OWV82_024846 [Melia azedarach]